MKKHNFLFFCSLCVSFLIGCKETKTEIFDNSVGMRMVKLPYGYYVSKNETTQSQFETVMGFNPSTYKTFNFPVESITGNEAIEFCKKLTEIEKDSGILPEGFVYTLPTYEQWLQFVDDAPLKGSITPRGRRDLELKSPMPVASGEINSFGLYDLRGNVSEYSIDFYASSINRLHLGASWLEHREDYYSVKNKSAFSSPNDKSIHVGFRCVLIPKK